MYILGLNAYHGDASACIFKDDMLIAASEEERFRRIKHWAGFPSEAIKFCLAEAKINLEEVDFVTLSRDPYANITLKAIQAIKNRLSFSNIKDRVVNLKKAASLENEFTIHFPNSKLNAKIINVEHHRSHLASAFFVSPFSESALLSIDGFGDFSSMMTGVGKANQFKVLQEVNYPHSAGLFYTSITQYLGFPHYGDEYKVMGLAPYGKPLYTEKIMDIIRFKNNGLFELNLDYFVHTKTGVRMAWDGGIPHIDNMYSSKLIELLGPVRLPSDELTQYHKDIASSVQKVTEDLFAYVLTALYEQTKLENVCIAGGVAQNSVANGKIKDRTPFKNIYIPPAAHDAGTSIGSALFHYHQNLKYPRTQVAMHGYYGSKFSNTEIQKVLDDNNISYQLVSDDDLFEIVSNKIIEGCVIGWFQGRAEFGPRALGHRSILADPRREDAKEILNLKIKRRESFRPFAPSILKEHSTDFFEHDDEVPFMERVFKIKEEKRKLIPAVTHVDGTGRLQTVDQKVEPKYYGLINSFYQKTNIPILLNTSFNENEPIVNTPQEALNCYLRTKMDMLVLENFVIERK